MLCCGKYRCFLSQSASIIRKQTPRVQELNCKKEFGCEREQGMCSAAPGSPERDELWKVSKGKTSAFGLGVGGVEIRPCQQLSHISAQVFTRRTIPLFTVLRQKSNRATYLTCDGLIPASLPGEISQGTTDLLSSAPAEELSQPFLLPKHHLRRDTQHGDFHWWESSGSRRSWCHFPGVWKMKLKFLPEFPVTNSQGDFLGSSKYSQFLNRMGRFRKDNLCGKSDLHAPWTTWGEQYSSLNPCALHSIAPEGHSEQKPDGAQVLLLQEEPDKTSFNRPSSLVNSQLSSPAF